MTANINEANHSDSIEVNEARFGEIFIDEDGDVSVQNNTDHSSEIIATFGDEEIGHLFVPNYVTPYPTIPLSEINIESTFSREENDFIELLNKTASENKELKEKITSLEEKYNLLINTVSELRSVLIKKERLKKDGGVNVNDFLL